MDDVSPFFYKLKQTLNNSCKEYIGISSKHPRLGTHIKTTSHLKYKIPIWL